MSVAKFTTEEKVSLLLKKNLGKPSTDTSIEFYSEPSIVSRPKVFTSQILSSDIPTTRPSDGWRASGSSDSYAEFSSFTSLSPGDILEHSNGVLQYYFKMEMVKVTNGNDMAFKVSGGTNFLEGSIPFNYDSTGGYAVQIFRETGGSPGDQIFDGTGEWAIDPDAGILTFYEQADVNSYVNEDSPPYITFFKYTGETGITSVLQWTTVGTGIKYNEADKTVLIGLDSSSSSSYDLEVQGDAKFHSDVIATQVICSSDRRLKKEIVEIQNPIEKLKSIRGVSFRWKSTNKISFGVIADEIETIMPGSVTINPTGFQAVNYNSAISLLIEAVKKQAEQISELRMEVEDLKSSRMNRSVG